MTETNKYGDVCKMKQVHSVCSDLLKKHMVGYRDTVVTGSLSTSRLTLKYTAIRKSGFHIGYCTHEQLVAMLQPVMAELSKQGIKSKVSITYNAVNFLAYALI
jgi:hypothetical protein